MIISIDQNTRSVIETLILAGSVLGLAYIYYKNKYKK
jgi:hypothetical protein